MTKNKGSFLNLQNFKSQPFTIDSFFNCRGQKPLAFGEKSAATAAPFTSPPIAVVGYLWDTRYPNTFCREIIIGIKIQDIN
ncbi:hypothetical protein [Chryseobacterium salivictor]|nr:hypothetical protein [Chryseobacterium salivictor]